MKAIKKIVLVVFCIILILIVGTFMIGFISGMLEDTPEEIVLEEDTSVDVDLEEEAPMDDVAEDKELIFLGDFSTTDVYGETVTKDIFADYDLTLVNVWATWCSPCVQEIPHLADVAKVAAEDNVGVLGIVMDVTSDETLGTALEILDAGNVEFPVIVPDQVLWDAKLGNVTAYPETFFVDSEGNILGESYVGARDANTWLEIIDLELALLEVDGE